MNPGDHSIDHVLDFAERRAVSRAARRSDRDAQKTRTPAAVRTAHQHHIAAVHHARPGIAPTIEQRLVTLFTD